MNCGGMAEQLKKIQQNYQLVYLNKIDQKNKNDKNKFPLNLSQLIDAILKFFFCLGAFLSLLKHF